MKYFAYGSNLCFPRLLARGTDATFFDIGHRKKAKLVFNKKSAQDNSAKANIEVTDDPSDDIWGALFEIPEHGEGPLKKAEAGYFPINIEIETCSGLICATTFIAESTSNSLKPYIWYKEHIIFGAVSFGLPTSYIDRLHTISAVSDSDIERSTLERAYWPFNSR